MKTKIVTGAIAGVLCLSLAIPLANASQVNQQRPISIEDSSFIPARLTPARIASANIKLVSLQNTIAAQNSGIVKLCATDTAVCKFDYSNLVFSNYGNDAVFGLQDCTFAAVADWEEITLGVAPVPSNLEWQFIKADPKNLGLTNAEALSYWRTSGIGQSHLNSIVELGKDSTSLMTAINNPTIKATLVELHLVTGQNIAGYQIPAENYHWVVVDGYTPVGPVIVTWGRTLQMTWEQWNLEVAAVWSVTVSS